MRFTTSRLPALLLALVLALVGLVVASPQASAASNWKISRYHSTVTLATDGLATVVVDFDFHVGNWDPRNSSGFHCVCLLYTSDAADE